MHEVDEAALDYLHELLCPENQQLIATALVEYQGSVRARAADYGVTAKHEIAAKQRQYDALLGNLSCGTLPSSVVSDIVQKMQALNDEMDALREAPPPQDYTSEQIKAWLDAIKAAPDKKAVHLLIDRITVMNKTDISIASTLTSVLGDAGWGSRI